MSGGAGTACGRRNPRRCLLGAAVPRLLLAALLVSVVATTPLAGQRRDIERRIRQDRDRLEEMRRQRQDLEQELRRLRAGARNVTTELRNLDQQRTATSRLVNELDRQISGLSNQLDTITFELILAEDAIAEKRAVLERRVVEIYKRGPLWAFQVLLAAESFGDLVSRYKYLFLVSRQDRSIIDDVETLRARAASQRRDMLNVRNQMASQRTERDQELQEYAILERQRQRALANLRQSEQRKQSELETLASNEEQLSAAIAELERRRRAAVAAGEPTTEMITDADLGELEWPVDGGTIAYEFGPGPFRDGTEIRYNGIGIAVPTGTPVKAVRAGTVRSVAPIGTYGPQVWIDHGGGFYTIYLHLSRVTVRVGQLVGDGEVVGLSGGASSVEGPHIEFQIRRSPPNATMPVPMDPRNWLRKR